MRDDAQGSRSKKAKYNLHVVGTTQLDYSEPKYETRTRRTPAVRPFGIVVPYFAPEFVEVGITGSQTMQCERLG